MGSLHGRPSIGVEHLLRRARAGRRSRDLGRAGTPEIAAGLGIGRVSWSVSGLSILIVFAANYPGHHQGLRWQPVQIPFSVDVVVRMKNALGSLFYNHGLELVLLAVWITCLMGGSTRDPNPDAREWGGRLFLFLVFFIGAANRIYFIATG